MDVAKSDFFMEGFEEEYWKDSFYESLHLKGLILDFSELFEGSVFFTIPQMRTDVKKQKKPDFWEFKF